MNWSRLVRVTRGSSPTRGAIAARSDPLDRLAPTRSVHDALAEPDGEHYYCGSGKVAMRAILDALDADVGDNVVLPAAIPHALAEPFREIGVEPRYHRVTETLGTDLDHLSGCVDDDTVAVLLVHYFGFSNPDADAVRAVAADAGVQCVEDNSHAALSAPRGRLLGTESAFGFTSLHKTLHVPNGAVLFTDGSTSVDDPALTVASRPTLADCRFLARTAASRTPAVSALARRLVCVAGRGDTSEAEASRSNADRTPTPFESMQTYAATKRPMSWLTARVLELTSPDSVVAPRRERYERLTTVLDTPPLYDLEAGVCPWLFPVLVEDAPSLARCVPGAFAWPRLPRDVAGDDAFPVANELARSLLALPLVDADRVVRLASVVG